jgi:hypothetical protein
MPLELIVQPDPSLFRGNRDRRQFFKQVAIPIHKCRENKHPEKDIVFVCRFTHSLYLGFFLGDAPYQISIKRCPFCGKKPRATRI